MTWPFDASRPIVTAAQSVAAERRRLGRTPEQHALPSTLVGTFQRAAFERLLHRAGVDTIDDRAGSPRSGVAIQSIHATGAVEGSPVQLAHFTVGAPAVAIALEGAIARGVRDILVVGSAGGLQPGLVPGSLVLVEGVDPIGRQDGTSHHYVPAGEPVRADPGLTERLEKIASDRGMPVRRGRAWTTDAPYRECVDGLARQREAGTMVVEMEAAAVFAVAARHGVRAALLVTVSDEVSDEWRPAFSHPTYLDALVAAADVVMDAAGDG